MAEQRIYCTADIESDDSDDDASNDGDTPTATPTTTAVDDRHLSRKERAKQLKRFNAKKNKAFGVRNGGR